MNFNWTKVNKLLSKNLAIWGKYGDFNYISDSVVMIKARELSESTKTKLLNIFGKFPEEEMLKSHFGNVSNLGKDFKDILDDYKPKDNVVNTKLVHCSEDINLNVFIYKNNYYYINNKYYELIKDIEKYDFKSSGQGRPLLIEDDLREAILFLPIFGVKDSEYLKELS